jgi:putative colanic acid biosynthesis acetyltransferase WcaF
MTLDAPSPIILDQEPWIDLRQYDQSWFERGRPNWLILLWWFVQAIAFPLSLHFGHGVRNSLLRLFGAKIGKRVKIRPTVRFTYPWKVEIGDDSWIGDNVVIYSLDWIRIGRQCVISQKSYLCSASHDFSDPAFGLKLGAIAIGNGVWIAAVQIGANTVIGVRSTVLNSISAAQVAWGHPCEVRYPRPSPSKSD